MALPSLTVNLGLNSVDFVSGLTKAAYQAQKSIADIQRQFKGIGNTVNEIASVIGLGFGVHEIVAWAKEVTLATEELQLLADQTGSSIEELSRLSNIVKISGGSVDTFQKQIDRLAAGLSGSEELSTKTANALQFLGVTTKDPAQAMQEIANKLNQFADGAGKAAIARDLFGKTGVAFLAQLKAIAEQTDITATKTAEQARQAEDLARIFRQLEVESHSLADAFLNEIAPALEKIGQLLVAATRETGSFFKGLGQAAAIDPFGNISQQITDLREKIKKAQEPSDVKYQFRIGPSDDEYVKQYQARLAILLKFQAAQAKDDPKNYDARDLALRQKPLLPYVSGAKAGAADDPTKKILEGQLKALDTAIAQEKSILTNREEFLRETFQQGYLSIQNYYAELQTARQQDINATNAYYDRQIALADAAAAKTIKASDHQDALNKAQDLRDKQIKFNQEIADSEQKIAFNRSRDTDNYAAQLQELNARMADLAGNTAKAAAIRFDAQNSGLVRSLTAEGNTSGLADVARLKASADVQNQLNQETKQYQLILGDIAIAQGYLNLAQQSGAISETEYLVKTSELNKSRLADLQDQIVKMREIASSPLATAEQIQGLKAMELEMARLAAATDLLADKFNKTFGDAFSSAFSDFISGTKTAKEAFNDFVKSVTKSISDIASQNIATALFGKTGSLSGIGEFFSKVFGGTLGKPATTAASAPKPEDIGDIVSKVFGPGSKIDSSALEQLTAANELTFAATSLTTSAEALTAAAETLGTSSAGSSASGLGGIFGSLFDSGGSSAAGGFSGFGTGPFTFANGTDFAPGGYAMVGERGPEIVNLPRGSQVIPNHSIGKVARQNLSIVVNVPQGTSGPSADQIGIRVGAHVQRALARNG